jgi:hypothetical protein
VNQAAWAPEERAEYDEMVASIVQEADSTEARIDLYEAAVADAVQARRFWATDLDRDARRTGYREQIKGWLKRNRVLVNYHGRVASKPRIVGTRRSSEAGEYDVQALLDALTFDEIEAKRKEYLRQVRTYSDNVALMDRLLALRDMAPDAITPREACVALGLALEDYLLRDAA